MTVGGPQFDEPVAVVAAGPEGGRRSEVLGALLDVPAAALRVPAGSYLVISHGPETGRGDAYLPGHDEPYPYLAEPFGAGPALARPPRRVEMTLPDTLLRHFAVVDTPDTGTLGLPGGRVLLDGVSRAGALLFVVSAEQTLAAADLELLAGVAKDDVTVFFVVTPAPGSSWSGVHADEYPADEYPADGHPVHGPVDPTAGLVIEQDIPIDPVSVVCDAHRAALLAAVPGLAAAQWFALDPATGDTAYLRRALQDWAIDESLRRASGNPPVIENITRPVRIRSDVHDSGWADRLDGLARTWAHRVRQHLALDLANIHLRCVQDLIFGTGCAGLAEALDREMHALSLCAMNESEAAVDQILDEIISLVFSDAAADDARRRVAVAVRLKLADRPRSRSLERALLVTALGGVEGMAGADAVAVLPAYSGAVDATILPPLGVGLLGGCYQHWSRPGNLSASRARSWLQRVLREVELQLSREVSRRFEELRLALGSVVVDAVDSRRMLA
ncbi:hypothetical protein [Micromonospora sonneratiae]|uniref:Dynamin family protein n=1 Tax=Micromonospora sonneratiae TaxID=1184706 RepID=A0ABW3YBE8_9ACTN